MGSRSRDGHIRGSILLVVLLLCFHVDTARYGNQDWTIHGAIGRSVLAHIAWKTITRRSPTKTEKMRLHRESFDEHYHNVVLPLWLLLCPGQA